MLLCILGAQGAAKLPNVKVRDLKKWSCLVVIEWYIYFKKIASNPKCQIFFKSQVCNLAALQPFGLQGCTEPHLKDVTLK